MHPFTIHVDNKVRDDLRDRLQKTRWIGVKDPNNWELGTSKDYLQKICEYWLYHFDWQAQETYLNSFAHYKTHIEGQGIHFIYEKGKGTDAIPLLLTHGYPDSFVRFLKLIPLLTQPDEQGLCYDVIVPSIPGYGFSDIPSAPGMNTQRVAGLFHKLLTEVLGYDKFLAHGGDWGAGITEQLALYHGHSLLGIHLTDVPFQHALLPLEDLSKAEEKYLDRMKQWQQKEGAYALIQSTKPHSLAYSLNDSPAGLAAWILEKFYTWSDRKHSWEQTLTKDMLLTNIMIYWVTQTIHSSFLMYHEAVVALMDALYNPITKLNPFDKTGKKSDVPAAFAVFDSEISTPPRAYAERFFAVRQWTTFDVGGHFAAMEQPEIIAREIRTFTNLLHKGN